MVTSTYPDFFPFCGYAPNCGNTCCVPSDNSTNGTAQAAPHFDHPARAKDGDKCNGDNAEAERILKCIKQFSAAEWRGCTHDAKFECGCSNDEGLNFCCGSADQAEAIEIWSQCLAGA